MSRLDAFSKVLIDIDERPYVRLTVTGAKVVTSKEGVVGGTWLTRTTFARMSPAPLTERTDYIFEMEIETASRMYAWAVTEIEQLFSASSRSTKQNTFTFTGPMESLTKESATILLELLSNPTTCWSR